MPLLKDGRLVEDPWRVIDDASPLPASEPAIVSFARFQAERDALLARSAPLGVTLRNTDAIDALAGAVDRLELIALEFPKFSDGRAYSQARGLRERLGFAGELRVTGDVLIDQALESELLSNGAVATSVTALGPAGAGLRRILPSTPQGSRRGTERRSTARYRW